VQSSGVLGPGISDLLQRQTDQYTGSTRPKAFLNWVLLDEQFKIVNSSTGFEPVGADGEFKTFVKTGLPISQNGYLYVYTSNESPVDVFFDNLQVSHIRGPLLEETHYYPFGLTMAGISAKGAGNLENKYKYNGNEIQNGEFSDGSGLNAMDFNARAYEHQLGRFWQLDPIVKVNESPYSWNTNNPILFADPDGRDSVQRAKALQKAEEYVSKKEKLNQYLMGAKGDPGEQVDCSGLVSKSVEAGGEKDPNHGDKSSGVLNIQENTTKLADEKVQPGNIVTFKFDKGYPYHTGIIVSTVKDKNGNIMKFVMINSVSGTGPKEQTVTIGEGKLGNGVFGYYKWDTKPDKQVSPSISNGQTGIRQNQVVADAPTSVLGGVPALKFWFW